MASSAAVPDYFISASSSELVLPSDRYSVVSVTQTQEVEGEGLLDVLDIAYTVTGRPGVFTIQFPLASFRVFESGIDLSSEADIIERIYSLVT